MPRSPSPLPDPHLLFPGTSELAGRMRALDWTSTPLGPVQGWPQSLRTAVSVVLASPTPMILLWGSELVQFYNDGYRDIMGAKHPGGLGQRNQDCWPEVWDFTAPIYQGVLHHGQSFQFTDQRLVLKRHGVDEETYFTLTYTPVRDEEGGVGGILVGVQETTERVQAQRQLEAQHAELEARNRALEGFADLTRTLGLETDPHVLVRRAQELVQSLLPGGYLLYYERNGERWRNRVQTGDVRNAELQAFIDAGPLGGVTPSVDVPWTTRQALYQDQYARGSDTPQDMVGHVSAAASVPVLLHGEPVGVFIAVLFEQRTWTREDHAVLDTVVASLGLALERAEQEGRLVEERAALAAFTGFVEAVGVESDELALARQAVLVLSATLEHMSAAYHELEDGRWKARVWSDDIAPELVTQMRQGVPQDAPQYAEAARSGDAVFADGWSAAANDVQHAGAYGAEAFLPLVVQGETRGLLTISTQHERAWMERERAVARAVTRGLLISLERTEAARRLAAQNAELEMRTRALEGFAEFTRDLTLHSEPQVLIRRALEMAVSLLSSGLGLFYERRSERWHATVQVGQVGTRELQAAVEAGFPVGQTPTLDRPFERQEPWFQEVYDRTLDVPPDLVEHLGAVATLPVVVSGQVAGIFNVVLFEQRHFSEADRALLVTVVRSLGLALEGARGVAALAEERRNLATANEELETFSYSVSHDLRTPVRHIAGFTDLLRASLGEQINEWQARHLGVIAAAGTRMSTLIDAMLDLSRTARLPLHVGPVNLAAVCAELEPEVADRTVQWAVTPLPLVMADHDTLRQVIVNLLSNALKYTRPREVAEITVWAQERERDWAVFVHGVGFDPRYQERLFGVFQRLHRAEEFEGTGVGLANVRRIVERHGGTVWAQGTPGTGATFRFTIPKDDHAPRL